MKPWMRRFLPQTLFARTMLILIVPMVLVQAISAYMFYDRHWENVRRNMAAVLADEIALLVKETENVGYTLQRMTAYHADTYLGLQVELLDVHMLTPQPPHLSDEAEVLRREL
ncbi:MAG: hypothetical protein IT567_03100, partial [Alphaproteobacteria bacterium]|nr:hypothetical protein [Alphaproteobacteria bacterium]